ncbi:MAG TPA: VWA domain-containing protein [Gammaproteobacteria bacterium]
MSKLTPQEIHKSLDEWLDVEFSHLKTAPLVEAIAHLPAEQQRFILDWVRRVASIHVNLAYRFGWNVIGHLGHLDPATLQAWALHAMDRYDQGGLHAAMAVIEDVGHFIAQSRARAVGATFEVSARVLLPFLHGLSGRRLALAEGDEACTDSETIFLPSLLAVFDDEESNFRLYKAMAVHQWALVRYGTFRIAREQLCAHGNDTQQALAIFHRLETLRLDALIERELPGLYRQMAALDLQTARSALPPRWQQAQQALSAPGADVYASSRWLVRLLNDELPPPRCYQGRIDWQAVTAVRDKRLAREQAQLRIALGELAREHLITAGAKQGTARFTLHYEDVDPDEVELRLDEQALALPEQLKGVLGSIMQDLGEIPEEYLVAAGPGEYDPAQFIERQADPDEVWQGTYHEAGAFLYDEWDYQRQHYRKHWCAVREKVLVPVEDAFVAQTMHRYGRQIAQLRRSFEAMRDEDRLLKKQSSGDGVDIDALIEALADAQRGRELPEQLFTRNHRAERNIAVLFMVDMSGSTKGWINDAEREALLLLCEALESLGDRYAIYGFSGMTRKRCEIYRIKAFDEDYDATVRGRISAIRPQDYTRMGFAIRHLSKLLLEVNARTRLLITLSDGKPDDYHDYRGEYGIEDTRRALIEAKRSGIHPYCITIDEAARDYLPRMYGPAAFTVVSDVQQLPRKVSDIYRRLTV